MSTKINAVSLGIACGATLGLIACAVTTVGIMMGKQSNLAKFFISLLGYEFNMQGAFIGLGMGILHGFIAGALIGSIYNWVTNLRK